MKPAPLLSPLPVLLLSPVLTLLLLPLLALEAHSQTADAPAADRKKTPPSAEAAKVPTLAAGNKAKIRAMEGKDVVVTGLVESTSRGPSGVQILRFKDSELAVVCFKSYLPKFTEGQPADLYKGKTIQVSGKLELYKKQDQPQIKLRDPAQISILNPHPAPKGKSKSSVDFRKYFCP